VSSPVTTSVIYEDLSGGAARPLGTRAVDADTLTEVGAALEDGGVPEAIVHQLIDPDLSDASSRWLTFTLTGVAITRSRLFTEGAPLLEELALEVDAINWWQGPAARAVCSAAHVALAHHQAEGYPPLARAAPAPRVTPATTSAPAGRQRST
jgi:hypothetical protein